MGFGLGDWELGFLVEILDLEKWVVRIGSSGRRKVKAWLEFWDLGMWVFVGLRRKMIACILK